MWKYENVYKNNVYFSKTAKKKKKKDRYEIMAYFFSFHAK